MPCYHPLKAYRSDSGEVVFHNAKVDGDTIELPCGRCIGCRLERSRQWAIRCIHEAQLHEDNAFITLTYKDMPEGASLDYRDFQLFMKRLRKHAKKPVRFFMCGEYGERLGRPHFHACLFGYDFPDKLVWSKGDKGARLYRSPSLDKLWPFGFSTIGPVNFETAAYVARYVTKKVTGDAAEAHYRYIDPDGVVSNRQPEFCHMSLKPGIGADWLRLFHKDVFPRGHVVLPNGSKGSLPRYYKKYFSKMLEYDQVEYQSYLHAQATAQDRTPERLAVRELVANSRNSLSSRSLK